MTVNEIKSKYLVDASQDNYEVWAWEKGSNNPTKIPYSRSTFDKDFIVKNVSQKMNGKKITMIYLMKNGKLFMKVK